MDKLDHIYVTARGLPVEERAAYLDRTCDGDAPLRQRVEQMLSVASQAEAFLPDAPDADASGHPGATPAEDPGEAAGERIGPYLLLEKIGEGGMGTVWMAQQTEPMRRRVALKVIKLGMDTREVVHRFEAERQALALMDHPHIARVLDGGATASGRPYFVMELVRGTSITEYCDHAKLGLRERLELFTLVCAAVQHAHHKGIIHRDIKPTNVLVTLHDGVAIPKVIDFGIAKATNAELTQKTLFTRFRQFVGTPEYMAPEQAEMSGLDLDTRADVYSLGVLLYELLTGTTPFNVREALEAGYDSLLRTIREIDPPKPSTRVSTLGVKATPIETNRHVDAGTLSLALRGDLDWIVMKALEKDRTRRYESPHGLAEDIGRYFRSEVVAAHPPSSMYRLRKFVRRRRKTVAAVAISLVLLVAGSIGTGVGWWRAVEANRRLDVALAEKGHALDEEERQRALAETNATRARDAEAQAKAEAQRASAAEEQAKQRAQELERVVEFQSAQLVRIDPLAMGARLRDALLEAVPAPGRGALMESLSGVNFTALALDMLSVSLFSRSIEAIDQQFAEQPIVQARLLYTMGNVLRTLGLLELARDPVVRSLELRRDALGVGDPETLSSMSLLSLLVEAGEAEPLIREATEGFRRALGPDAIETLNAEGAWGLNHMTRGDLVGAERLFRDVLERCRQVLGTDHEFTLNALINMGLILRRMDRQEEALPYLEECLAGYRRRFGETHQGTILAMNNLASWYRSHGRVDEAEALFRSALEQTYRLFGDRHPSLTSIQNNLGYLLVQDGRNLDEAETLLRRACELDGWSSASIALGNLGKLLVLQDRLEEAEPLVRRSVEARRQSLGDAHELTDFATRELEVLLVKKIQRQARMEAGGFDGGELGEYGELLLLQGRSEEARPILETALEQLVETLGASHWRTLAARNALGATLAAQGQYTDAEPLLLDSVEQLLVGEALPPGQRHLGVPLVPACLTRVVNFYDAWNEGEPDEGHDEEAAEWREELEVWTEERNR